MADSPGGGGACCRCCSSFILTLGFTALFMWLSLRTSKPVCSIQDIFVPILNKSDNSTYPKIYFDLKLDNENKDKGIYYDTLNLTFYYSPNLTTPIGNMTFPGFYQGHKKNARRKDWVEVNGVPWTAAKQAVLLNGSAIFRVDLATAVRYKIMMWKTKRHKLVVGADVLVNDLGKKFERKGVRLSTKFCSYTMWDKKRWEALTTTKVISSYTGGESFGIVGWCSFTLINQLTQILPTIAAVSNGAVVFQVGLMTAMRFKVVVWKTNVEVNEKDKKVKRKEVRLKSGTLSCAVETIGGYF